METSTIVRILLGIAFIGFLILLWKYKPNSKYKFKGIQQYTSPETALDKLLNSFPGIKPKKKKRVNKKENMCRKILQQLYQRKFPSIRPSFLKSPRTGKNLELDCYNKELKIALEYNGKQHYGYNKFFHKKPKDFYAQVHRDDWKRKKCKEKGIRLIEVPYWVTPIDLKDYIIKQLYKHGCL